MLLLKALARLVELALMAAVALVGIGVGLYCLSGLISLGSARPDRLVHLPRIRRHVSHFLAQVTAPGGVAVLALLLGVAAILAGLLVFIGLLGWRRERLLVVERDGEHGDLLARPRAVSRMLRETVAQTPGVSTVKRPRVSLARSGRRGRVRVLATRGPDVDAGAVDTAVHERVDPVTESLHLKANVRVRLITPKDIKESAR